MDRAEAIEILKEKATYLVGYLAGPISYHYAKREIDAIDMAIAALREQEQKRYTAHEVAVILAEFTGDDCACNFNGNDEWLPEKCELLDACPRPVGVACWEQYLKHRNEGGTEK